MPRGVFLRGTVEDRYWSNVDRSGGPDSCWPWSGRPSANGGYGRFAIGKKHYRAHRWAYIHFIRPLREDELVCHHCDNPPCQNPSHWFVGTSADNCQDMIAKGRMNYPRGERHPLQRDRSLASHGETHYAAKLTDDEVAQVRALWAAGGILQREIAAQFGVGETCIYKIIHRITRNPS